PNTRMIIDLNAFMTTSSLNNDKFRNINTSIGLQLNSNYFFARRFSIFLNANAFQNFRNERFSNSFEGSDSRNNNFQFNFNSGLTYAFY
ncbi:MAG: hypothetical protein QMB03_07960, partial [Spirosomataceae bacterium]